ncbi:hypothetical protein PIB30_091026 [Stylosanthes scabra]|uniref:Transposase n=1 Tax=Stylosanthes scabra TaxID=79078 RepID=A0ABU6WVQ9_9FABA|nr:hypothetical protein [Stylosanthes scabra]
MTEEPPPPPSRYRGSGYRSLLHPIIESNEARPPLYKSFYDEFPDESFSKNRFTMLRTYLFWKNSVVDCPLCGSFLADLNHLKRKGLDFTDMFAFQGWTALFHIKERVYPEMNPALNISYSGTLAYICTRISLSDRVTPTHRSLGPVYAQLHHVITHIIMPQNGSYQKISFCDTLVLFALIMRVKISFTYLMMRHMHDSIKGDRNSALPYGMFLTKVFKAYFVNLDDEPYEEKFSKGGGAVKKTAKRDLRAGKKAMEEEERRSRASSSRSRNSKGSAIKLLVTVVRELIQEVINMASCTSTALEKSKARGKVLEKCLNKLEDDHEFSKPEEEEDEEDPQDSQEEDEDVSDAI